MKIIKVKKYKVKEFKPIKEVCRNCKSKLKLDKSDIEKHTVSTSADNKNYYPFYCKFTCPICSNEQCVSDKNFHKYLEYLKTQQINNKIKELEEEK